jgi:opacity protein-like surface antigen
MMMLLFLPVGGISVQAQLKFGIKAGINLENASLKGDVLDNLDSNNFTGFQVGPMLEFTIPVIGLGLDVAALYSQQGMKVSGEDIQLNNLEVPVNLKYKLSFFKLLGVYGTAGPYINFKLSDSLQDQFEAKSFGAGLNFGAGVELLRHLQVGVNYRMGLTDDYQSIENIAGNLSKWKTETWSITAAYLF